MRSEIKKTVRNSVYDSILADTGWFVIDSVYDSVRKSVWKSVWKSVGEFVSVSVWNPLQVCLKEKVK